MNRIVMMKFGSHLYGTDTPDSDLDFKGVFMPSPRSIVLGRIPKHIKESTGDDREKNKPGDIDREVFSLHTFLKLACEGQTVAMDMLHAPQAMLLESSDLWREIVSHRDRFYTKNLKAFVGYCRRQAAKYGVKGSRLNAARSVVEFAERADRHTKLSAIWESLPEGEHIHRLPPDPTDKNQNRIYQVCGKKFLESARLGMIFDSLGSFVEAYGHRAELAAKNQGIDWKAVSHALRAAFQVREILTDQTITFPLKEVDLVKAVKLGKLDYLTEVAPRLESLMDEVQRLSEQSDLPEKVDRSFWDDFLEQSVLSTCFPAATADGLLSTPRI